MSREELLYSDIGNSLKNTEESKMFGMPCFKINGKAFIGFYQNCMVFKLSGNPHGKALSVAGACLFDPSGKARPMKEWVVVPPAFQDDWPDFAHAAFDYVSKLDN